MPSDISEKQRLAASIANSRKKYGSLSNEQNMHRMVCSMFNSGHGTKREIESLLYRKISPSGSLLYIQSDNTVDTNRIDQLGYRIVQQINLGSMINTSVKTESIVALNAKLMPTKTVKGKKICIEDKDDRLNWVKRKGTESGFEILEINEVDRDQILFDHSSSPFFNRENATRLNAYTYHVIARITDVTKFQTAVRAGIGRGRAYGCGMTLFRPIETDYIKNADCS